LKGRIAAVPSPRVYKKIEAAEARFRRFGSTGRPDPLSLFAVELILGAVIGSIVAEFSCASKASKEVDLPADPMAEIWKDKR
jgi:hypothetical protein